MRMVGVADLTDLRGYGQRLGHAAGADEARDRRGRRHRAAAEADRLDDRAVAHVRVGVVGAEAGEVEPDGRLHRGDEPALAEPRDADPEIGAVARHRGDERRSRDGA